MIFKSTGLDREMKKLKNDFSHAVSQFKPAIAWKDVGRVNSVYPGVAYIEGLTSARAEEIIEFENGEAGIVFNIDDNEIGCVLLCESHQVKAGMEVASTGKIANTIVGEDLLGRVIDPTGKLLDQKGPLLSYHRAPIEGDIPGILDRTSVKDPLETGIKTIDTLVPIGKGQRQLILGDRQTGKTSIAIDTIINQRDKNVICIYCAIGQRSSSVASVVAALKKFDAMKYTVLVVAEGNNPPGIRFIAPYAATAIGEYFMRRGEDVLIVYDDLTNHARTYREISLLLRRPPGREAFPGDIFYIHSRLLERSTHLKPQLGGGSLTALPIIETQNQDISAYIPTNLISITDGQICLSKNLYQKNILPAIDLNLSVSRVGGKAQLPVFRAVASDLKLSYSQFVELETFLRFGTRLDPSTKSVLDHGHRIRRCLNQRKYDPLSAVEQLAVFLALQTRLFRNIELEELDEAQKIVREIARKLDKNILEEIMACSEADSDTLKILTERIAAGLKKLRKKDGT